MIRRLLVTVVLVAVSACIATTLRVDQTLSAGIGDLMAVKTMEITTQSGDVLLRGTFSEPTKKRNSGKLERVAALTSPANAASKGRAVIDIDRRSGLSDEEIIVKLSQLPYPESCRLLLDGRELTMFSTSEQGALEFRLARRVALSNGK